MSTHNIGFDEEISKIIPYHKNNMHIISSSDLSLAAVTFSHNIPNRGCNLISFSGQFFHFL